MIDISTDLDLFEKQTINITRRSQDFSEITSKESEFSRTFLGPVSKKNLEALDNYGLITANSTFNPHKGIECIWTVSTSSRFEGRLEVRKVIYENGNPKSIEFVFYGKQRTLANIIGTDRFSQVDWGEYDHALTYLNVKESWGGDLVSGKLLYPLIDSRQDYFIGPAALDVEGNISHPSHPILLTDLKPAILLSAFLVTVFENYNLTLTFGTILSSFIDKAFVLPNRLSGSTEDPLIIEENQTFSQQGTTPTLTAAGSQSVITFGSLIDPNNQITSGNTYTAIISGTHTIFGFYNYRFNPTTPDISDFQIVYTLNGDIVESFDFSSNGFQNESVVITPQFDLLISAGDELQVLFVRQTAGNAVFIQSATWEVLSPLNQLGGNIEIVAQMPDDKIVEWLSKLFKAWNLIIEPDPLNANNYTLLSQEDWFGSGQVLDWSKLIDISNVVYSKKKVYKELKFQYTTSESSTQETFIKATGGRSYGELNVRPDVEFGDSTLAVNHPCNVIPPSVLLKVDVNGQITGNSVAVTIHKSLDSEGAPVAEPWLLFYNNGAYGTVGDNYYLQSGFNGSDPEGILQISYPRISSVQDAISLATSNTLAFALENPLAGTIAQNTAYKVFWQSNIINQYDPIGRKVESSQIFLTTKEFVDYKLNDEIFLEGRYWRIVEIRHSTNEGGKAIATLETSRSATIPPAYATSPGGKINFTDGTPDNLGLTELGAITQGTSYYIGSPLIKLTPNLNSYLLAKANISLEVVKEINALGGRFRTWNDEA